MKIESYEPYHIGIKFSQFINIDILKHKLRSIMEENKFNIPKEQVVGMSPLQELLAIKNNVNVKLNRGAMALNAIGYSKKDTMKIHNEIINFFNEINYDLNSIVKFYEIIANITVKINEETKDILNNSLKDKLPKPIDYLNKLDNTGMRFRTEKSDDENEFFDLLMEPSTTSPKNRFFIRVVFRSKERDKILAINDQFETIIITVLTSLGAT